MPPSKTPTSDLILTSKTRPKYPLVLKVLTRILHSLLVGTEGKVVGRTEDGGRGGEEDDEEEGGRKRR